MLSRGGVKSNKFQINSYQFFWILFYLSNQSNHRFLNTTNFEHIQCLWLHPIVGVKLNEQNSNSLFCSIESQIFESNWTNCERIPIWLHPYIVLLLPLYSGVITTSNFWDTVLNQLFYAHNGWKLSCVVVHLMQKW